MDMRAYNLPDEELIASLREAANEAWETVYRSRALIQESHSLLRLIDRMEAPLIETR
jgi:hypothetical protein